MRTWWKQLVPYLVLLSFIGNIYLGIQLYNRDRHLNLVTWGNVVDSVWKYIDWAGHDLMPRSDGRVMTPNPQRVFLAVESLEAPRSLPHFSSRVPNEDLRTLEQFLRYADRAYAVAAKEQGEKGTVSAESLQRMAKLKEGFEFIIRHQERTNRAKSSRNPWNHAEWRAVWQSIAAGLKTMEFVPLPD